jgi:hypothetical protein
MILFLQLEADLDSSLQLLAFEDLLFADIWAFFAFLIRALPVVSARPRLKRQILRNKISGSGFDTYISGAMHVRDLLGGLVLFLLLAGKP